jgi:RHS repeat-associated protein
LPGTYANNNGNPPYNTNPNSIVTATSAKMYKLNAVTGDSTGLGFTIKVMAGDTVSIYGRSFWHSSGTTTNTHSTIANDLLTILASTNAVANAGKGATSGALTGSSSIPTQVSNILSSAPNVSGRPKAYINWMLFDERFKPDSANSGFDAVDNTADVLKTHSQAITVGKSGFLYVWVSNASNQDVFFDNLQVIHNKGPLLEETHYYPFGLTMAGISSKAAGKLENRYKYNGIELNEDLGLETYDAFFRNLDPQTGRWWQIDPKIENQESESPYSSMANNPILKNDPLGDFAKEVDVKDNGKGILAKAGDLAMSGVRWFNANLNPLSSLVEVVTGKSVESDFTADKSRAVSGMEAAISLIPGAKLESAAIKATERALISLDNNALIAAVEGGGKDAVKAAIGSNKPIVSMTAAKEFLAKGDKGALKDFMKEVGATISTNGASKEQVSALQKTAAGLGRTLGAKDASIIGGAINNGAKILTNDKRMGSFMEQIGVPLVKF